MMLFMLNIALAFIWAGAAGGITSSNLLIGFGLGYIILLMQQRLTPASYNMKVAQFVSFSIYFAYEVFVGAVLVAWDVVTPQLRARPGIVAVPLDGRTPAEIAIFANALSLTPGTITLDLSPDQKTLYVHSMFVDTPDKVRHNLKQGLERRLLTLLRLE